MRHIFFVGFPENPENDSFNSSVKELLNEEEYKCIYLTSTFISFDNLENNEFKDKIFICGDLISNKEYMNFFTLLLEKNFKNMFCLGENYIEFDSLLKAFIKKIE